MHRITAWTLAFGLGLPFASLARDTNPAARLKVDLSSINRDVRTGSSYSSVIRKASPSVVNIYSTKTIQQPRLHQFFDDPFFDRFFGGGTAPSGRRGSRGIEVQSLGSGVIVTEDGYILTNNHVVDGADPDGVEVAMADGKQKFTAKVIGKDPQTDLAVLKIEGNNLPAITLADSDKLEVGDVVLAIGNPYNVGKSTSMGIISALGRAGMGTVDYEDFIQTDAAINPGHSGGALVDTEGRLIGINQSIASPTRSNAGIGFAVPVNLARHVLEQLVADGTVKRGFLGVMIQPLTPELAKAFNLQDAEGALISGVSPNTPAASSGFKKGDLLVEVNGKRVSDSQQARLLIAGILPGTRIPMKVIRDGKEKVLTVKLSEMPDAESVTFGSAPTEKSIQRDSLAGVEVMDLTTAARREHGIPNYVKGALVTKVDPDSAAFKAGVRSGYVIQGINREDVENAAQAVELSENAVGDQLLLSVWSREGAASGSRFIAVDNSKKK